MTLVKSISSRISPPFPPYQFVRSILYTSALCLLLTTFPANISFATNNNLDLSDLSLEQLMNLEVITVSRKPEPLAETAAAVFVISNEDLQRSGVTNIADALRMAPGIQVAQVNSHTWAVSIRGFNDRFGDKLLVLMDGRTLYNPLHSGVTWEVQDMILEDIERIEIIRGPGASMWGANAVNGVINIITKNSQDTQGTLLTAAAGSQEQFHGQARFGDHAGEDTSYRVYGKYLNRDAGKNTASPKGDDSWTSSQGGFRIDHTLTTKSSLSLIGDLYKTYLNDLNIVASPPLPLPVPTQNRWNMKGYHILGTWQYSITENNSVQTRLYYDTTTSNSLFGAEDRDTLDFDFQHIFPLGNAQSISWGMEYRYSRDDIDGTYQVDVYSETSRSDNLYSAFLQDEITLFDPRLKFTVGSKFEHNNYTGFELQPTLRTIWQPAHNHSLWAAVSRAVHTPSRYEHDGIVHSPIILDLENDTPTIKSYLSSPDFESEVLIAYEAGYRCFSNKKFSFDIAFFFNDYDNLSTNEPLQPSTIATSVGHIPLQPYIHDNKLGGQSLGGELVLDILPHEWWRIQAVYSYLQMQLKNDSDSFDNNASNIENTSPTSQFSIRSHMALSHNFSLNLWLRFVSSLPAENTNSYWDGDIRVSWKPVEHLEVSLVGQNLLHSSHKEMEQLFYLSLATEVERSSYIKLSWNY